MKKSDADYLLFLEILRQELIPATGCTEPIAIAYAAAVAAKELNTLPTRVVAQLSGNIIKNAKAVTIPNTGGQKGIKTAIAAGIVAGDPGRKLEVISHISPHQQECVAKYAKECPIAIQVAENGHLFEILLTVSCASSSVCVHVLDSHTNIVSITKDGKSLLEAGEAGTYGNGPDYGKLSVTGIIDFAESVAIEDIRERMQRQVEYNSRVSQEGLSGSYGANIGKTLLDMNPEGNILVGATAAAAAASDARMSGCDLPVVITAGSGNQGLTTSLPVIEYARQKNMPEEALYRALVLASLLTVHQKHSIGKLSAFCGAVSAGASSAAGIAFLNGGRYLEISHTIVNTLAIASGMVCDGAKPSCAAKIAMAVQAALLGYEMFVRDQQFYRGEGLVAADVEATIANIGRLGKEGMRETDREILQMMINE